MIIIIMIIRLGPLSLSLVHSLLLPFNNNTNVYMKEKPSRGGAEGRSLDLYEVAHPRAGGDTGGRRLDCVAPMPRRKRIAFDRVACCVMPYTYMYIYIYI